MNQNMNIPTQIIIFGITGDLSQKKILPSLFDLYCEGLLPERIQFTGFSRRPFSKTDIEDFVRSVLIPHEKREDFVKLFNYVQGDFATLDSYTGLKAHVDRVEEGFTQCSSKLYYLSVSPQYYESILTCLKESGLSVPCSDELGWARILVEKPFGYNRESSERLNVLADSLFKREQMYRIDHYMVKTSLQDIVRVRSTEPLREKWNADNIQEIRVDLLETVTVDGRGEFYDSLGVVFDVGQNHALQMIALALRTVGPHETSSEIQSARENVFESLSIEKNSAQRGQYAGYLEHNGVKENSSTETYASMTFYSSLPDFKDVPVRLRLGKGLLKSFTAVTVVWKDGTESVYSSPSSESKGAYKKVLLDCMHGDQSVFTSGRESELGWKIAEEMKKTVQERPLQVYEVGDAQL